MTLLVASLVVVLMVVGSLAGCTVATLMDSWCNPSRAALHAYGMVGSTVTAGLALLLIKIVDTGVMSCPGY